MPTFDRAAEEARQYAIGLEQMANPAPPATFTYDRWRHGGWYVGEVRYPSGAVGCVSNNYADKKWRIACDPRPFDEQPTFRSRDYAAAGEYLLVREMYPELAPEAASTEFYPSEAHKRLFHPVGLVVTLEQQEARMVDEETASQRAADALALVEELARVKLNPIIDPSNGKLAAFIERAREVVGKG